MSIDPDFANFVDVVIVEQGNVDLSPVKKGDKIEVHYTGRLNGPNGKKFDSSLDRNEPFGFTAGQGEVIKGWDEGLLGASLGQELALTIKSEWAYGDRAVSGNLIPANSTLWFKCKIMSINGKKADGYPNAESDPKAT